MRTQIKYSIDDFFRLTQNIDKEWFEYENGVILWRHSQTALEEDLIAYLLNSAEVNFADLKPPEIMATRQHHGIISNLFMAIGEKIDRNKFKIYAQGPEVKTGEGTVRVPDATISNLETEKFNDKEQLTNPEFVAEVTSKSTQKVDYNQKLAEYKATESIQEYLIISQKKIYAEQYSRQKDNSWQKKIHDQENSEINLPSFSIKLKVSEFFRNIF